MPTLILTPRLTPDTEALAAAARERGIAVARLSSWRVPPDVAADARMVYGEPLFAEVVASACGLALLQTPPSWLPSLPEAYLRRAVALTTVAALPDVAGPAFIKPADENSFPARVYAGGGAEVPATEALAPETPALVSEPVVWEVEYRCVVADREALACSPYWRDGRLAQAKDGSWPAPEYERAAAQAFIAQLLGETRVGLPPACVVDVGRIAGRGWAVVEANSVWGAGIYGCDPAAVLDALARAVVPRADLTPADAAWARATVEVELDAPPQLPAPDAEGLVTLYRPVGARELALIAASDFRAFPPRLPEQPIFSPVLSERYASEIARGWNTRDVASGDVGHVTRFQVRAAFLARYPVQVAGASHHQEYWIPAEELDAFNAAIVGEIAVIATYRGEQRT